MGRHWQIVRDTDVAAQQGTWRPREAHWARAGMARLDGELLGELFGAATRVGLGGVGRWVSETVVDDRFGLGPLKTRKKGRPLSNPPCPGIARKGSGKGYSPRFGTPRWGPIRNPTPGEPPIKMPRCDRAVVIRGSHCFEMPKPGGLWREGVND